MTVERAFRLVFLYPANLLLLVYMIFLLRK